MIDIINEKLKGYKISFNLESAVFNKDLRALSLSLVYPDECILSEDIRKTVKAEIYELLPDGIKTLDIKYKKNCMVFNLYFIF